MDSCSLVSKTIENVSSSSNSIRTQGKHSKSTRSSKENTSTNPKNETNGLRLVRQKFKQQGLKNNVIDTLMESWRERTKKQYKVYLEKWIRFCNRERLNALERDVNKVLEFLQYMYRKQYSFSALNTARSALSCVFDSPSIGDHILIRRFMRSVFNTRPNLPRYSKIWDVSIVLKYLENCSPGKFLNLLQLSQKLTTLIALTTGQRAQTIGYLNLDHVNFSHASASFNIQSLLKHNSQHNKINNVVTLVAYPNNKKLCAVTFKTVFCQNQTTET